MQNTNFNVAVCMITYNQEKYIAQAIESVLAQATNFNITLFIGDDHSTDGTSTVCRRYKKEHPDSIMLIRHEHNLGTVGNTFAIFEEILNRKEKFKYTAMLDGDDYWCNENKLQKQIDFLEKHPDHGLIHTDVALLDNLSGVIHITKKKNVPTGDIFLQSFEASIANCTVVYRTELLARLDMDGIRKAKLLSCDYITNVVVSKWGKVGFIDEITAVWRRNIGSVSAPNDMSKALGYLDHEIGSGNYLSSLFPVEYPFLPEEQNRYIARRKMEIAQTFNNYDLAVEALNTSNVFSNRTLLRFSLTNRLFFALFLKVRDRKKKIEQSLNRVDGSQRNKA
ncbi:MAG: glycosyltransferase [Prevotellaceae bacterium]|jgi:glycosyltransferase involved in cell wall biosynthesis|nr:glycosyltransferase [Prevotellaceae bacterium]